MATNLVEINGAEIEVASDIFEATLHWTNNACVNPDHIKATTYIEGFKRAGELLSDHVMHTQREQDFLIFPILYNYRHYMELALKYLLISDRRLLGIPLKKRDFYGHGLQALWEQARPKIVAFNPNSDPSPLEVVDEMIEVINKLDPNGETFRYNETALGVHRIGIDTVRIKMAQVSIVLDGAMIDTGLALDHLSDMIRDFGE